MKKAYTAIDANEVIAMCPITPFSSMEEFSDIDSMMEEKSIFGKLPSKICLEPYSFYSFVESQSICGEVSDVR